MCNDCRFATHLAATLQKMQLDFTLSQTHSNASLLIANGVPLPVIADRLGHASPVTTSRVYSHAFKSSDSKAADILAAVLNTQEGEKENHA